MMKKAFYYMAGACAVLALQTACSPQFEDLFDKSASERLEEAMDNAEAVLTAADKGWAMGIYYTHDTRDDQGNVIASTTRGRLLFARFTAGGEVTLTDYNQGGASATTTYSMNTSQGPVLNFDTYSEVLGEYVDPGTWLGGSTDNYGDFEFVIFRVSEDEVILKGKKYHAKVVLRKITGDGEMGTLWQAYHNECEAMYGKLFASGVSPLLSVDGKSVYTLTNPTSRTFEMYPYGSTNPEEMTEMPFLAYPGGIDLMEDLTVEGKSVRTFVYDEASMTLKSQEDATVQIVGPDVYEYFPTAYLDFIAGREQIEGKFVAPYEALAADFNAQYAGVRDLQGIGFTVENGKIVFVVQAVKTKAKFTLPGKLEDGKMIVEQFDAANFPEDDMDNNAKLFYQQVAGMKDFLPILPGEYTLENKGGLLVASIELVSVANAADKMLLSKQTIN